MTARAATNLREVSQSQRREKAHTRAYCTAGGGPVTGRGWPLDPVYFPDYTLPRAQRWWEQMVEEFHDLIE